MAESFLRKRVAGIPVAYLLGGGVVVLAVVAWRMKSTSGEDTDDIPMEEEQNQDARIDLDTGQGYDAFVAKGSITAAPAPKPEDNTPEETNNTWLKKAVEWRVSQGASAGTVQNALQAYLAGAQLSAAQGAERDRAVKQFGLPPDPSEKTNAISAPISAPIARSQGPLPRYHKVTNSSDDTFVELAKIYYPTADRTSVTLIAEQNRYRLVGSGPFKPGTQVKVPAYRAPKYYTSTKKTNTLSEIARKNGLSKSNVQAFNPGMKFPLKSGTRVRVA